MYYAYILYSKTIQRYYAGSAHDLENRVKQHNHDQSKSTRMKGPWELVICFPLETRKEAQLLEKKIKKRGISRFLNDNGIVG